MKIIVIATAIAACIAFAAATEAAAATDTAAATISCVAVEVGRLVRFDALPAMSAVVCDVLPTTRSAEGWQQVRS